MALVATQETLREGGRCCPVLGQRSPQRRGLGSQGGFGKVERRRERRAMGREQSHPLQRMGKFRPKGFRACDQVWDADAAMRALVELFENVKAPSQPHRRYLLERIDGESILSSSRG